RRHLDGGALLHEGVQQPRAVVDHVPRALPGIARAEPAGYFVEISEAPTAKVPERMLSPCGRSSTQTNGARPNQNPRLVRWMLFPSAALPSRTWSHVCFVAARTTPMLKTVPTKP